MDAAIKTVRDMFSSLRLDVDARRRKVDEILATIRHDITAVETNLEESKAKITSDTDQVRSFGTKRFIQMNLNYLHMPIWYYCIQLFVFLNLDYE